MRNYFSRVLFYSKIILSLYCLALTTIGSARAYEPPKYLSCSYDPHLTTWLMDYLETVTEDTPLEEVIDSILDYRECLMLQGYVMPTISDMMPYFQANLLQRGIELPDEQFEFLRQEFIKRERRLSCHNDEPTIDLCKSHKHKHHDKKEKKKDKWEFSFTRKSIFGLIKFIGGTLTILVPHPAATTIGAGLIINGIEDMVNECRDNKPDPAEENKRIQKALEAGGCP